MTASIYPQAASPQIAALPPYNGLTSLVQPPAQPKAAQGQSGLAEHVLKATKLSSLNLKAFEVIDGRDSGNAETLALLKARLLENPIALAPLQQLDANFIRLKAARALVTLADNPGFAAARQTLGETAQIILSRPFDDTNVKVELLYGLKSLGLDKTLQLPAPTPEMTAKLNSRLALAQLDPGKGNTPHHVGSSANFQVYA